jgi:hypothetical protein
MVLNIQHCCQAVGFCKIPTTGKRGREGERERERASAHHLLQLEKTKISHSHFLTHLGECVLVGTRMRGEKSESKKGSLELDAFSLFFF